MGRRGNNEGKGERGLGGCDAPYFIGVNKSPLLSPETYQVVPIQVFVSSVFLPSCEMGEKIHETKHERELAT